MARESKRKRDDRRFGRPERLADQMFVLPWVLPEDVALLHFDPRAFLESVDDCPRILADNVSEYFVAHVDYGDPDKWRVATLPCVRLPFPVLFVECRHPLSIKSLDLRAKDIRVGALMRERKDPATLLDAMRPRVGSGPLSEVTMDEWTILRDRSVNVIEYGLVASTSGKIMHMVWGTLFTDDMGVPVRSPITAVHKATMRLFDDHKSKAWSAGMKGFLYSANFPLFLAVAFMNCKNVGLTSVEPDLVINCERQKAGLKPFVRYHTINIEPMKQVLRTEGQIESVGLKRALHICRGHFATYTEDRPLFGHFSGTVWKPSHVRGSARNGMVISDYDVKAPPEAASGSSALSGAAS